MDEARKRAADKREAKNRGIEDKEESMKREERKIAIEKLEKRYNDLTHRVSRLEDDQVEQLENRHDLKIAQ